MIYLWHTQTLGKMSEATDRYGAWMTEEEKWIVLTGLEWSLVFDNSNIDIIAIDQNSFIE